MPSIFPELLLAFGFGFNRFGKVFCVTRPGKKTPKIFNDPVHGTMIFQSKLVEVIDTPQFQRLRNIKQLGTAYHLYPGASHNRFEHSLGTAHLAGKFIRMLQSNQSGLEITDEEILCVEMAGLCHDLGHGPFSHMFDQMFLPAVGVTTWQHEQGSCDMFDDLLKEGKIRLSGVDDRHDKMVKMVKLMIKPPKEKEDKESHDLVNEKPFLYEIISNERNKVDVDKWDYFARDCHQLGIRNSFDHDRFMKLCRVLKLEGGVTTIGSHKKECKNLYEMFHTRAALHKRAYQHRISVAVNLMLCDAFILADKGGFRVGGYRMSEVIRCMREYIDFDDNIIDRIMQSDLPGMKESKAILRRIEGRKFYRFVTSKNIKIEDEKNLGNRKEIEKEIAGHLPADMKGEDIIAVNVAKFDYGMKHKNPCEKFYFYTNEKPDTAIKIEPREVSEMLPSVFGEYELQVFCKKDEYWNQVSAAYNKWQENKF